MRKNIRIGIAIVAGIILLAAAAYLGVRLLAPGQALNSPFGGQGAVIVGGGEGGTVAQVSSRINYEKAEEIPQRAPEISGAVTEMKDNSLKITNVKGAVAQMGEDGETKIQLEYDGSATEVVVTRETQIYLDTTFTNRDIKDKLPEEGEVIQQTVENSSFSELGVESMVSVWGYKRGDRLVAEVILVNQPFSVRKK